MTVQKKVIKIFMVRGLARETRHWGVFIPNIQKSFPDAVIHPLEIPGTGRLKHQTSPTSIDDYVQILRQQYLYNITENDDCKIIGLSLGGMMAAHWLAHYPQDFSAAVLINTSGRISTISKRLKITGGLRLLMALCHRDPFRREKKLASLLCNLADQDKTAHDWAQISKTAPVSLLNFLRQFYAAATFKLPANNVVETLILCSRRDRLVSYESSGDIAFLWQKEYFCHDEAGHDLTTDDPNWCIEQLRSWPPFTNTVPG